MKIQPISDIHLEFYTYRVEKTDADVLVIAGDLVPTTYIKKAVCTQIQAVEEGNVTLRQRIGLDALEFIRDACSHYKYVIYVAGNHEYYDDGKWLGTSAFLKELAGTYEVPNNFFYLEDTCLELEGVVFVGSTLWTDMNRNSPDMMNVAAFAMNDYRQIKNENTGYTPIRPIHTVKRHTRSARFIDHILSTEKDRPIVVVSHHAPTFNSIGTSYVGDALNGAYASDLSHMMYDRDNLKFWFHGHVHEYKDYQVGSCRVICNPRGYASSNERYSQRTGFNPSLVVEI